MRFGLDRMNQVRKLHGILYKKHRNIITDQIPITLLGIKLHCKSTYIAHGIGRATLSSHGRKPDEYRCALACLREGLLDIRDLHDTFAFVNSLVPLAAAAVLKGDDTWAARILAIGKAVTERTGAAVVDKPLEALRDQTEREVRARLGPDRWQRACAAGRTTSIDALIADIDQALGKSKDS